MTTRYDQKLLLDYACRIAAGTGFRSRAALALSNWVECAELGLDWPAGESESGSRRLSKGEWSELTLALARARATHARARPDAFARNLRALTAYLGLDAVDGALLEVAVRYAGGGEFQELCDFLVQDGRIAPFTLLARMTGLSGARVGRALRPEGRLIERGLVEIDGDAARSEFNVTTPRRLHFALCPPSRSLDDVCAVLFGRAATPEVEWSDFDHLGQARDFIARILEGALRKRTRGINILLYGPPGTGKTAFCSVLAHRLGAKLYAAAEHDERGRDIGRRARQQQLRLCQHMLADRERTLILFDEMEDLLPPSGLAALFGDRGDAGSKVALNRLLERNPVPTLWTTNDVIGPDPAILRRMTFALELSPPPAPVRKRVWRRVAESNRLQLDSAEIGTLAREFDAAPALAAGAVRAASVCGGSADDVRLAVRSIVKVMHGGMEPAPRPLEDATFDPALAHADLDLESLAQRLGRDEAPRAVSLCLTGPPGSGKSAYARYLAAAMGLDVVHKRASDLVSKWVGETEKQIAGAFAEARQRGAFLIFDEADSLLGQRDGDRRSWEVSMVNEMLTWMESHPLPFACTTNLATLLDPASLRRFTFKVRFDYLGAQQAVRAFRDFLGVEPPDAVGRLDRLTPGDFAVVRRKAEVLGVEAPERLAAMLEEEQAAKPGHRHPLGFNR